MKVRTLLLAIALTLLPFSAMGQIPAAQGGALGFYRYPALHGDLIVFAAEGDLWRVSAEGGVAHRLTTHAAEETDPVISPDGSTIAFTARYEGPTELYTMPIEGGLPVRRTYESDPSRATTWTPDGRVVYATRHYSTLPQWQLVALDLPTQARERIPLETASEGAYDDSGRTLFFVRPAFHGNVTKRYTGGTARDVWKFEQGASEAVELTGDYEGESHSPMYWQGRVYFVSDRDGTMNLWSMTSDGGDVRQHTRHSGWDVRNPALEGGRIVYELAADLRLYDIASGDEHLVPITLSSDFDQLREKWVDDPMQYLSSAHLDAEGERLVLTARGRVFVAPVGAGRIVRASNNDGARYRDVVFLPNGETLVGLSDESGEMEWVTLQANGTSEGRSITGDGTIQRRSGLVSPDGRWLAYDDNNADLWILDLQSGAQTLVSEDREGFGGSRSWSPDSRWLAFGKAAANTFVQIVLYSVDSGASVRVTSDRVNSTSPAWGPNGEFLYFLSDRNLQSLVGSPWGSRQPEPYFDRQMEIYHVSLRPGLRSPFQADDELTADDGDEAEDEAMDHDTVIDIELDGLPRRTKRVPIRAGNFAGLTVNDGALFFLDRDAGSRGGRRLTAVAITSEEPELVTVAENVGSYELSANGKKMLLGQGNNLYVIDARAAAAGGLAKHRVDLSDWAFPIDVREDFREIFIDLWRQERDWFYDPAMHGVEWDDVRDKYLALVDRVTTRDELSDVIGRVVGELSALHTSVRGGDVRTGDDNVPVASLGARIARTSEGDLIEYIYQSDPDYPEEMSPLADPDLGVSAGDLIQAVNGIDVLSEPHIGALLRNPGGDPVRLRLRSAANGTSREVMVTPTMGARALRYSDWEYTRRMDVEERGEGDIGYVHLQAMGGGDLTAWYRQFYPVFNRQGLIIDVRQNRGGNIDSFILEKLMRQAWMYFKGRTGEPTWNMQYAFRGHMVVLMDQTTASDGEAFADGFRRLGLGEVIGMRSWGGEIWLSNNTRASDGGLARTPQSGVYGPEGEWLIEQIGLVPDIVVDNLPHATFNGEDAQLDAAIRHLQQKIADDPRPVPPPPPYPNRGFRYRATTDGAGGNRPGGAGR